ncbi:MMPL family transporter [Janibacter alittae]|uniref:MMPL family transporter n=1 Tax=Janibacter alittae TaxID=3115209 RepID=A0ABZ2MHS2_9MICO
MSTVLHRLGRTAFHRPIIVLLLWLAVLGGTLGVAATSDGQISTSMTIDDTASEQVLDRLQEDLPQASGGQGTLVFTAPEGQRLDTGPRAEAMAESATAIAEMPELVDRPTVAAEAPTGEAGPDAPTQGADPNAARPDAEQQPGPGEDAAGPTPAQRPLVVDGSPVPGVIVSTDGAVAMLQMQFTSQIDELPEGTVDEVVDVAEQAVAGTGVSVLPSQSLESMHPPIGGHEVIGLVIALLVLLLTLGSLWSAGLPILTALTGVGIGFGGAFALSSSITLTTATPALALMVGLAVGIDYALFILNRQRRLILTEGLSAADATAQAVATAGSAVVFAGSTVVIALVGMSVIGIGFLTTMAFVAATTVALAVLIALTLLPALLGLVGERVCSPKARERTRVQQAEGASHSTNRWVEALVRRPWVAIVAVVAVLGLAAVPALGMQLGMPSGGTDPRESTSRQSYDAITRGFGEGFNAPLVVVARPGEDRTLDEPDLAAMTQGLEGVDDVASASLMGIDPDRSMAMFNVIPEQGPDDERTGELVEALRATDNPVTERTGATLGVTGLTAVNIDITERLGAALPEYVAIIVGLSLLLLLLVFRSVVIPIKATVGFLLSIAATFGVTTAVFQWGWFIDIVGLDTPGPLLSFLPIMVTGILYGLAMDYQVFLVSSMREAHVHGQSPRRAIVDGFEHSSRVVTAAAVIMVSVFASFVLSDDPMIKQFGFALSVGVLIDAFLVRMTLVPAVMSLLDHSSWWLPGWLDRLLPTIDVEGQDHDTTGTPADPV